MGTSRKTARVFSIVLVGWFATVAVSDDRLFVSASAVPGGDGLSWATAFQHPQTALSATASGGSVSQIWVAKGTYMPDGGFTPIGGSHTPGSGDPNATFQLRSGVALYGGFAGNEAPATFDLADRDFVANETILRGVSSYHVVTGSGTDATAVIDGFTISGGVAAGSLATDRRGGGMYNVAGSPTVGNCRFADNWASWGGGMYNDSASPQVTQCTFTNTANVDGGGMYNDNNSNPVVSQCTFGQNYAWEGNGGGMFNKDSRPIVVNCTFNENLAFKTPVLVGFGGGGMYNSNSSPTVTYCNFTNNIAHTGGGGMYNSNSSPTVTHCTFDKNVATFDGGGMYNGANSGPMVAHCTFSLNSVQAPDFASEAGSGGGIYNTNSSPIVTHCEFVANAASLGGGGMFNSGGNPSVTDCIFNRNRASDGDGTSVGARGGGIHNSSSSPAVTHCVFIANVADVWGGGIANSSSSPTITNCSFDSNKAMSFKYEYQQYLGAGGGIFNSSSSPTVTHCAFIANVAARSGGGIDNSSSSPTVTNCSFDRNKVGSFRLDPPGYWGQGGGMNSWSGSSTIRNCTFSGNQAINGGGLHLSGSPGSTTVVNCILWGNTPSEVEGWQPEVAVSYSLLQGGWPGIANINADPLFVNAAGGDLRLSAGSPCIDAGDNTAIPAGVITDLDGNTRVTDDPATPDTGFGGCAIVDLGAFEFQAVGGPSGDSDGDGVCDSVDLCPNTIPAIAVDDDGCPDPPIPADYDNDGDVDAGDFAMLRDCQSCPAVAHDGTPTCEAADLDNDGDVDHDDYGIFQRCYSGQGNPAEPNCAE